MQSPWVQEKEELRCTHVFGSMTFSSPASLTSSRLRNFSVHTKTCTHASVLPTEPRFVGFLPLLWWGQAAQVFKGWTFSASTVSKYWKKYKTWTQTRQNWTLLSSSTRWFLEGRKGRVTAASKNSDTDGKNRVDSSMGTRNKKAGEVRERRVSCRDRNRFR